MHPCTRCGRPMPPQCLYCAMCGTRMPHPLGAGGVVAQRFAVQRSLSGKGAHQQTFLAQEKQSQQFMVLKELRDDLRTTPDAKLEFQEEIQTLRTMTAPGVQRVLGMVPHEGRHYLVLEYVQGRTLRQMLQKQPRVTPEQGLQVLKAGLTVLKGLHDQFPPVLHLDVTPDNLLLGGWDKATLLDGAWLRALSNPFVAVASRVNVAYAAPETLRGQAVPASDLYALAATVLEALLGVNAGALYQPDTNRLAWAPLPHPLLQAMLAKMLEPAIAQRFATADEALAALSGAPVAPSAPAPAAPAWPNQPQPAAPQPAAGAPRPGFGGPMQPSQQPAANQAANQAMNTTLTQSAQVDAAAREAQSLASAPPPEPRAARAVPTNLAQNIEDVSTEEGLEALMALYEAQNS